MTVATLRQRKVSVKCKVCGGVGVVGNAAAANL
jgi:hypothetical protein